LVKLYFQFFSEEEFRTFIKQLQPAARRYGLKIVLRRVKKKSGAIGGR